MLIIKYQNIDYFESLEQIHLTISVRVKFSNSIQPIETHRENVLTNMPLHSLSRLMIHSNREKLPSWHNIFFYLIKSFEIVTLRPFRIGWREIGYNFIHTNWHNGTTTKRSVSSSLFFDSINHPFLIPYLIHQNNNKGYYVLFGATATIFMMVRAQLVTLYANVCLCVGLCCYKNELCTQQR